MARQSLNLSPKTDWRSVFLHQTFHRCRLCYGNHCMATVYASDDKENLNSISLKEAVNKTLLQHPDLPGYNELIKGADGYIQHAGVGQRPELSFMLEDVMGTGSYSNIRSTQSTLSLSWLLESEILDKRTIIAEREKSSLVIQQEVKRLDIASETARYYLSALFFQKKKSLKMTP